MAESYTFVGLEITDPVTGTSVALNLPAGVAQDDVLIAGILSPGSGAWASAGWTNEGQGGSVSVGFFTPLTRLAPASPPASYTFTGGANDDHYGFVAAYRGPTAYSVEPDVTTGSAAVTLTLATGTDTNSVGPEPLLVFYCWVGNVGLASWDHDHTTTAPSITIRTSTPTHTTRESNSGSQHIFIIGDELWQSGNVFPDRTASVEGHTAAHADVSGNIVGQIIRLTPLASQGMGVIPPFGLPLRKMLAHAMPYDLRTIRLLGG